MEAEERDLTIGPGKLLGLFFMLVTICGVFFGIGYSLGKTSSREQALNDKSPLSASLSAPAVGDPSAAKPSAAVTGKSEPEPGSSAAQEKAPTGPDLTFFNAVKRTDGNQPPATGEGKPSEGKAEPQEPPVAEASKPPAPAAASQTGGGDSGPAAKPEAGVVATTPPNGALVVQVAAVTREEDAAALAGALRKKSYNVFVVNNPAVHDKYYHVQIGPFGTLQSAEEMKARLAGEGFNPIVKKS